MSPGEIVSYLDHVTLPVPAALRNEPRLGAGTWGGWWVDEGRLRLKAPSLVRAGRPWRRRSGPLGLATAGVQRP
jgi:hypothetical protein